MPFLSTISCTVTLVESDRLKLQSLRQPEVVRPDAKRDVHLWVVYVQAEFEA